MPFVCEHFNLLTKTALLRIEMSYILKFLTLSALMAFVHVLYLIRGSLIL